MKATRPFTYADYRALIHRLRERGYAFAAFPDVEALLEDKQPFCLMRHDIDMDLHKALAMAVLEEELGVSSTYFMLIRTDHYNVFSEEGSRIVREILSLGHHLGLHFDCAAYDELATPADHARACSMEASMLENWFGTSVDIISYHRPAPLVLSGAPAISSPRPHTYMETFTGKLCYVSDSRGDWRHGSPTESEAFHQGTPLHVLIHPIWWCARENTPYQTLVDYLTVKNERLKSSLRRNCSVFSDQ